MSDIQNIKTSLELFSLNTGKYPLPDGGEEVLYGIEDDVVWTQGTAGNTVTTNLSRNLNEKPTDPLTETEYTYSVINSQTKYELLSIYESDLISYNNLLNQSSAASANYPKVDGNYNGIFIKTENYYFPTPSIITSEIITGGLTLNSTNIQSQIITGGENIPSIGITESVIEGLDITLSVYTGSIDEDSLSDKTDLLNVIKTAYSGSTIATQDIYKEILAITDSEDIESFIDDVVLNSPTFTTPSIVVNNNCNASTIIGTAYSTVTYNYSNINDGESVIGSGSISIDFGTKSYTGDILCTDGNTTILSENEVIDCNNGYYWNGSECIAVTSLIPIMTSDTTPSGEAFSSSDYGSFPAYKAFDNNASTFAHTAGTEIAFVGYKFDTSKVVTRYNYKTAGVAHEPRDFQFQASNDGVNWITLDTKDYYPEESEYNDPSIPGGIDRNITNTNFYLYYRFYCTKAYFNLTDTTPYLATESFDMYGY